MCKDKGVGGFSGVVVGRRRVGGHMGRLTGRVSSSCGSARPIVVYVLGNTICFFTSVARGLSLSFAVSFTHLSDCGDNAINNRVRAMYGVAASVGSGRILVIRSVVSDKGALGCFVGRLGRFNPTSVGLYTLLGGPSEEAMPIGVSCLKFRVRSGFVINCNLSFSRGCERLPFVTRLGRWGDSREDFFVVVFFVDCSAVPVGFGAGCDAGGTIRVRVANLASLVFPIRALEVTRRDVPGVVPFRVR